MKNLFSFCFILIFGASSLAQAPNPVHWSASYKAISSTEGEIIVTAQIDKNWHTYSQRPVEDGPIPTNFVFNTNSNFELVGKTEESEAHEEFVEAFGAKIFVFTNKAEFKQKVKLKSRAGFPIGLKVEYMSCDDKMCLPPKTVELSVKTQ